MIPNRLYALAVVCIPVLLAPLAKADEFVLFPFDKELSRYVQRYRAQPDPTDALNRLIAMDMDSFAQKGRQPEFGPVRAILMAFFAHILYDNQQLVLPFARRVAGETRGSLASFCTELVAIAAVVQRDAALESISEAFRLPPENLNTLQSVPSFPYPQMSGRSWEDLDVLWASYFASGNLLYLRRIAEPLEDFIPPDGKLREKIRHYSSLNSAAGTAENLAYIRLLTAQASAGGMRSVASADPAVLEFLEGLAERSGSIGEAARWNLEHLSLRSHFVDQ